MFNNNIHMLIVKICIVILAEYVFSNHVSISCYLYLHGYIP